MITKAGRRCVAGLVLVLAAATSVACSHTTAVKHAVITASPSDGLLDSAVTVSISGLGSDTHVTVGATTHDTNGVTWTATADFTSTESGSVSLAQPSTGGTYRGVDPMGLFDLLSPQGSEPQPTELISPAAGYDVQITATVAGKTVATTTVHRSPPQRDVTTTQLRPAGSGVYGELDLPKTSSGRKPAVLVIGGSEGGVPGFTGRMLAAHGYPSLGLAYFGEPGLPQTLDDIRLEYFVTALQLLRRQPDVDPQHVLVLGTSRGSEAALLLGAHYPELVNGVIAGSPSSVANPGYPSGAVAWTLHGAPVPTVSVSNYGTLNPSNTADEIPVQLIRGPVFTACGQDDRVWPSCGYAAALTTRLATEAHPYRNVDVIYPNVGHAIGSLVCCYATTPAALSTSGGDLQTTQIALRDAWTKLLDFLRQQ